MAPALPHRRDGRSRHGANGGEIARAPIPTLERVRAAMAGRGCSRGMASGQGREAVEGKKPWGHDLTFGWPGFCRGGLDTFFVSLW